jgi:phage baseplate assembly protein W
MGSVNLTNLKKKRNSLSSKPYTYVDLSLDLEPNILNYELSRLGNNYSENYRDIKVSYDEFAIKNSLINIFNTIPGQRFLLPRFGCNLIGYVFKPVTEIIGRQIGSEILRAIELWEPRVDVNNVNVVGNPDIQQYDIDISITIPNLKIKTNLTGVLSRDGFRESFI